MGGYIVRRLLYTIPVVLGVLVTTFILLRLIPGDPVDLFYLGGQDPSGTVSFVVTPSQQSAYDALRREFNLDKHIVHQFFIYLWDFVRFDFGKSIRSQRPINEIIGDHWPATIQLTLAGMGLALFIGIGAGVISAIRHHTWVDYASQSFAVFGVSIPSFFLGVILVMIFSVGLGWLPAISNGHGKELILPGITLGTAASAILARLMRSSMLDVLSRDYIRTARAKGLRERAVIWLHALRNALIPVVTVAGLAFGGLLTGTVIIESVFTRQGLGLQLIAAITQRDYPVVQGLVMLAALLYAGMNLVVDILYTYIDPRVRLVRASV
ncbi:MAG: ABC transporter permease [Chloroflexota bacterium]|nr:ABC transporter permease [Chloroflexota bacterium]